MDAPTDLRADLVCEGGGVKGIGLSGAVVALTEAGYSFPRAAGSSAGAVVASTVAALQHAGEPLARLEEITRALDYGRLEDRTGPARLPGIGLPLSVLLHSGAFTGDYLEGYLSGLLGDLGVRTFGDLRAPAELGLPTGRDWRLVVTVADLGRRQLVRVPWDLPDYGLDPDAFPVARAVRASSAIPYVFRPVRPRTPRGQATWVDGGLLSNFPVGLFDRADAEAPRWPTFGVRVSRPRQLSVSPVRGPVQLGLAALDALLTDQDTAYTQEPCTRARTIAVPTGGVSVVDFDLTDAQRDELLRSGRAAATQFLRTWDWDRYRQSCRTPGNLLPLPPG